jgi:hypothetical protein
MPDSHDPGGKVRLKLASDVVSAAAFSPDRRWRWWLERRWDGKPLGTPGFGVLIGMNPSTADVDVDDPTVAGCMWRARYRWGLPVAKLVPVKKVAEGVHPLSEKLQALRQKMRERGFKPLTVEEILEFRDEGRRY